MAIDFGFIGWFKEENHDKVWGIIWLEPCAYPDHAHDHWVNNGRKCITFWGRRGKKLQSKVSSGGAPLYGKVDEKRSKGYKEIDTTKLNEIYPEFQKDLQKLAVWSMLKY